MLQPHEEVFLLLVSNPEESAVQEDNLAFVTKNLFIMIFSQDVWVNKYAPSYMEGY